MDQTQLTLLFLLPAAGLDVVYVIFLNRFLQLLKFRSLVILLEVLIDVVRHLQVLCFSANDVAYGPADTPQTTPGVEQLVSEGMESCFSTGVVHSPPPSQLRPAALQLPRPRWKGIRGLGRGETGIQPSC